MSNVINLSDFRNKKAAEAAPAAVKAAPVSFTADEIEFGDSILTTDDKGKEIFDYGLLHSAALLNMIRVVLEEVSHNGLPGESSILIRFRTDAPGVEISERLRQLYPVEMTIQIDAWWTDMFTTKTELGIGLNFGNIVEHMTIPFDAFTMFHDSGAHFSAAMQSFTLNDQPEPPAPLIA